MCTKFDVCMYYSIELFKRMQFSCQTMNILCAALEKGHNNISKHLFFNKLKTNKLKGNNHSIIVYIEDVKLSLEIHNYILS